MVGSINVTVPLRDAPVPVNNDQTPAGAFSHALQKADRSSVALTNQSVVPDKHGEGVSLASELLEASREMVLEGKVPLHHNDTSLAMRLMSQARRDERRDQGDEAKPSSPSIVGTSGGAAVPFPTLRNSFEDSRYRSRDLESLVKGPGQNVSPPAQQTTPTDSSFPAPGPNSPANLEIGSRILGQTLNATLTHDPEGSLQRIATPPLQQDDSQALANNLHESGQRPSEGGGRSASIETQQQRQSSSGRPPAWKTAVTWGGKILDLAAAAGAEASAALTGTKSQQAAYSEGILWAVGGVMRELGSESPFRNGLQTVSNLGAISAGAGAFATGWYAPDNEKMAAVATGVSAASWVVSGGAAFANSAYKLYVKGYDPATTAEGGGGLFNMIAAAVDFPSTPGLAGNANPAQFGQASGGLWLGGALFDLVGEGTRTYGTYVRPLERANIEGGV